MSWPACAAPSSRPSGTDHPELPDAVAALLTHLDVYRSDYRGTVRGDDDRARRDR